MRVHRISLTIALLLLGACTTVIDPILDEDPLPELALYRGHYLHAEVTEFVPCDKDETWWVDYSSPEVRDGVAARIPAPIELGGETIPVFVEWEGRLSGPGAFGPAGVYEHELVVEEALVVRVPSGGDC